MAEKKTEKKKKARRSFITPSHTKGYYRFSKDFPSVTDADGYRDNDLIVNSPAKKASVRRRLIALFLSVFAVAFSVSIVLFAVSEVPVIPSAESATDENEQKKFTGNSAIYIKGSVLSMSSAESIIGNVRYHGMDAVIIDFKDAEGNFYYNPSLSVASDALSFASDNAEKIVKEFQSASIRVYARFCMYADDIYARTNHSEAAYIMTPAEDGISAATRTVWYNEGEDSHAWLNPFSAEVQYYLRCCLEDINAMGVDGIILDYVSIPLSAKNSAVIFDGKGDTSPDEKITEFIKWLGSTYIDCETAAVIPSDVMLQAFSTDTVPAIFNSGCEYIVPDLRLSLMPENTIIGTRQYAKPALSPVEFVTDYINALKKLIGENNLRIMPIIEASGTSSAEIDTLSGISNDSFIIYSKDNDYKNENF